jgi:4-amino-4-deoxy-L-arabinose transferase-like glycosyltransferase
MSALVKWNILLVLLSIMIRLPAIVHPKQIEDEGGYAVVAHELLAGGTLYKSALDRRPPLLFWLYALMFFVVGNYNWIPFHVIGVVWILLTMGGLYAIGKDLFSWEVGLLAALLYSIYTTTMYYENLALNGEVMMNLPIVWALFIAFRNTRARSRPELFFSGVLLGCAFLIKQPAAVAALPVGIYVLLPAYRRYRNLHIGHAIWHAVLLIAGFGFTLGIVALVLHQQHILSDAYYWTIRDHAIYHGSTDIVFWLKGIGISLAHAVAWLPLVLLCVVSIQESQKRCACYWKNREPELVALLILLGVSCIGVSASGRFYPHYYLQLLPPLALLGAPVLGAIWTNARTYHFFMLRPRTMRISLGATAFAFLIVNTFTLWQQRPLHELSQYVREHSAPEDKVFFWGATDYLYAEAQRRPASRYIHTFPLTGYIFGSPLRFDPHHDTTDRIRPGAWKTLQEEFCQSPPSYFVDTDPGTIAKKYPPSRYPFLKRFLAQNYEVVLSTPNGVIYKRVRAKKDPCDAHARGA